MRVVTRDTTVAGRSAAARYRHARAVRRRRRLSSGGLLLVAAACLGVGVLLLRGTPGRPIGGLRVAPAWPMALGLASAWAALRVWPRDDPGRWLRGSAGEQATAALLDRLPRHRWTVLHDRALPGTRANVDHVVIGPTGVWVVDSKAYRAPLRVRRGQVWAGAVLAAGDAAAVAQRAAALLPEYGVGGRTG